MSQGVDQAGAATTARRRLNFNNLLGLSLVAVLLLMFIILSVVTSTFATPGNISNLARQGAAIAILSVGETFVIITAGIDLSIGSIVGFSTVITGLLIENDVPVWASVLLTLLAGAGIGAFHGFGIVRMGLPPFIITLATLTALQGVGLLITNGSTINITHDDFTAFSRGAFLGVPNLFWMVVAVAVPGFVYLHLSRFGRYLFAVGSNAEAARLSGVNIRAVIYTAYILSGLCAAVVGVMLASRTGTGNATQANGWELQAIASSVIGGTSLFGAVGTIWGPLLGAFILATIRNGANLLNVNSFWQYIITGGLIIVIVYLDQLRRKKR